LILTAKARVGCFCKQGLRDLALVYRELPIAGEIDIMQEEQPPKVYPIVKTKMGAK
jgi:hypothetical protein